MMAKVSDPYYCRWSFEQLVLKQPQIEVSGLWQRGGEFFVVVPRLAEPLLALDEKPLMEWFKSNKAIVAPITLVAEPPPGAQPVPERTPEERATGVGEPRTVRDAFVDVALLIPRTFPAFELDDAPGEVILVVRAPLDPGQASNVHEVFEALQLPGVHRIEVRPAPSIAAASFRRAGPGGQGDLDLIVSRRLPATGGGSLRRLVERDEDLWLRVRGPIFNGDSQFAAVWPASLRQSGSRCLVNASVFEPSNVRAYLPLFEHVVIIAPIADTHTRALDGLGASEDDLAHLAARGRLIVALPHSVDRYSVRFISRLAEEAPDSLVLSRQLAALTVSESQRRIPLLYPPLSLTDRAVLLRALVTASRENEHEGIRDLARELFKVLSRMWAGAESVFHRRGAMASVGWGAGDVAAAVVKAVAKQDMSLELSSAGAAVEWAGAFRATLFPGVLPGGYSEQRASELCAGLYSGHADPSPRGMAGMEAVVNGVLAIDNHAPLADVIDAFQGADIERFRALVNAVELSSTTVEERDKQIAEFNKRVRKFEKRADKLTGFNLAALSGALVSAGMAGDSPVRRFVPLGVWLLSMAFGKLTPGSGELAAWVDALRGATTWSAGDVVLVSRLRRTLKR